MIEDLGSIGLAEGEVRLHGFGVIGSLAVFSVLLLSGSVRAMEGMDMSGSNNTCPLMVGMHEMHVSAYHPDTGLFNELCTEIPGTGPLSITIDAVSSEIRGMATEITVVKGSGIEPDPVTVVRLPFSRSPSGVFSFTADLDTPGKYALLVTLRDGDTMEMSGTHIMTVAHPLQKWLVVPGAVAIALAAALFLYFRRDHLRPKPT